MTHDQPDESTATGVPLPDEPDTQVARILKDTVELLANQAKQMAREVADFRVTRDETSGSINRAGKRTTGRIV